MLTVRNRLPQPKPSNLPLTLTRSFNPQPDLDPYTASPLTIALIALCTRGMPGKCIPRVPPLPQMPRELV